MWSCQPAEGLPGHSLCIFREGVGRVAAAACLELGSDSAGVDFGQSQVQTALGEPVPSETRPGLQVRWAALVRFKRAGPERAEVGAGASLLGQGGLVGVHSSLEGVQGVVPSALGVFWGARGRFTVDTPWSVV